MQYPCPKWRELLFISKTTFTKQKKIYMRTLETLLQNDRMFRLCPTLGTPLFISYVGSLKRRDQKKNSDPLR